MAKKKSINVTILVAETHHHDLDGLKNLLKNQGFVLKQSLDAVGVLTGSVAPSALSALSSIPGVSAVEEERTDYHTQPGS
ncbi:MAG: hypothetical protein ACK5EA_12795 [Planctomycetaceae bacterium]|jgi:hypothetical protein